MFKLYCIKDNGFRLDVVKRVEKDAQRVKEILEINEKKVSKRNLSEFSLIHFTYDDVQYELCYVPAHAFDEWAKNHKEHGQITYVDEILLPLMVDKLRKALHPHTKEEEKPTKPELKFKVGDYVRVKEDLVAGRYYDGIYFNEKMIKYRSKICKIVGLLGDRCVVDIKYEGRFIFKESWLELIKPEPKFKVGDKVRVIHSPICLSDDPLIGQIGTVTECRYISLFNKGYIYKINIGEPYYEWDEKWFELDKPEPKFKIGDYVRVKKDLKRDERYNGILFAEHMERYRGKIYKISDTHINNTYRLEGCCSDVMKYKWCFSESMLEPVSIGVDTSFSFTIDPEVKIKIKPVNSDEFKCKCLGSWSSLPSINESNNSDKAKEVTRLFECPLYKVIVMEKKKND